MNQEKENNDLKESKKPEKEEKHEEHTNPKKELNELKEKNKRIEKELENKSKEYEELNKKCAGYLSTASYYKNQAETNAKDLERFKERNKNIEGDAKIKANENVALKIIPIIDNFEQAISNITDSEILRGLAMIYSSLTNVIKELGVEEIKAKDEVLNPEFHSCIQTEETEEEELDGKIAKIYQKGYMFGESKKVIRPTTVSVYKK